MIVKSRVTHNVSFYGYLKYWLKRLYYSLPSLFAKSLETEKKFIFVIGCGHSGTTLMAAKLSNHSKVMGIARETGIFIPGSNSLIGAKSIAHEWVYFADFYNYDFILEKTPKHVYSYHRIKKILPSSKFIVMVRNPLDNISSLYKRFGDLDFSIMRWNYDNEQVLKLAGKEDVYFIKYEDFTGNPEGKLKEITSFLGFDYEGSMLESNENLYNNVPQKGNMKIRKEQVNRPILPNNDGWKKTFDQKQADKIMLKVGNIASKLGYLSKE